MIKGGGSASSDVEMAAEWALRGKESSDREYRLLDWSKAQLNEDNFRQYLQRYETGTLAMLPEVTVSWCSDKMSNDYLGIALHRKPEAVKYDAAGREFMETSLFCLNYAELAQGAVSYTSMYLGLRECLLPPEENGWPTRTGRRIVAHLPAGNFGGTPRQLAMAAAASMLAGRTVCVLGADRVSLDERLRLVDEIASVLPYGMRSRLSASTLTSSTYKTHNIRLFFAKSPRGGKDMVLNWGDEVPYPTELGSLERYIDKYIKWLYKDTQAGIYRLAAITRQIGFSEADVMSVIRELGLDDPPPPPPPPQRLTVEELLIECGRRLNAQPPESIRLQLTQLSAHVADQSPAELRQRYQEIVRLHQMLREDLPVADPDLRVHFYEVIVQVAFGVSITYDTYCVLEDSAEDRDSWMLHPLLAKAVYGLQIEELRTRLIVLHAIGAGYVTNALTTLEVSAEVLVQMTLTEKTQAHHRHLIYLIVIDELERRGPDLKQEELRSIFAASGYLTSALNEFYAQDPGEQLSELKRIFRLCFGDVVPSQSGREILGEPSVIVTPALAGALLEIAESQDMTQLFWDLAFSYIVPSFTGEVQEDLIRRFDSARPPDIEGPKRTVKKTSHRGKKAWRPSFKLDRSVIYGFAFLVIIGCVFFIIYEVLTSNSGR